MALGLQKNMLRVAVLTLFLSMIFVEQLKAQSPKMTLQTGLRYRPIHSLKFASPNRVLPDHVIQNPQGYSPLCRMELKIERQSPVGVWFKIDGNRLGSVANPGLASLRLKVPLGPR
jgi:hypothetical protein